MRPVRPPPLLRRLIHLNMLHNQVARIQPLCIRIRLCILQQIQQILGALDRPTRLAHTELLSLGRATCAACVPAHGDGFSVGFDVFEVREGAGEREAVDGLGCFAGVFEGDAQVGAAGASGFRGGNWGAAVSNLCCGGTY